MKLLRQHEALSWNGTEMNSRSKRITIDILLFVILLLADRLTKIWAVNVLKDNKPIPVIRNVLELYYLPNGNTGAAFGILAGHRILFLAIAIVVVTVISYMVYNMPSDRKYRTVEILLVFIASGGVGNMIDRIVNNFVIDFIYISCINFPIFNVADMYVSVCTVILAVIILFRYKEEDYGAFDDAFTRPFRNRSSKKDEK